MSTLSRIPILITEDDEDNRVFLEFILTEAGYQVTASSEPEDALSAARATHFDLYLLDNWLPGGSGIELCRALREFDVLTPILFVSGAAYETDRQNALHAGAQGYMVKPVDAVSLIAEISRLIADAKSNVLTASADAPA